MKTLFTLGAALTLLSACVPSVNPFYSSGDTLCDPRLLGEWREKGKADGTPTWFFETGEDKSYKLTVTEDKGKQGVFNAHLFKLQGELFLDILPSDCKFDPEQADLVGFALFPGHLLLRVSRVEPSLMLAFCDYDWVDHHLEENPAALAHHREGKRLLLTAGTPDLRRFVLAHLREGELFKPADEFVRTADSAVAPTKP